MEREKQAQLLNEVKKQEDQKGETTEFYQVTKQKPSLAYVVTWNVTFLVVIAPQNELQKKDERIAVLEEALTESVSIAAEREELLAQQAQNAETATHRVEEMEIEVERVRIETAVTNTKNASLVLALNENDIILSYYKSERHNMVEQLLEMRLESDVSARLPDIFYANLVLERFFLFCQQGNDDSSNDEVNDELQERFKNCLF